MYKICLIGLALILTGFTSSYSQEIASWSGEYSYYAEYPKNIGITRLDGSKVHGTELGIGGIVYNLNIDSSDNSHAILNESLFYYPDDTINCNVTFNQDTAAFFFKDFVNNRLRNNLSTEEFKPGQLLFTLEHKKNNQLITHWHALNPSIPTLSSFLAYPSYLATSNHLASIKNINKSGQIYSDTSEYHTGGFIKIEKVVKCPFANLDTVVAGIRIEDGESTLRVIGGDPLLNDDALPNASFLSQDKKQTLTIYFHPGDSKDDFSEFEVRYTSKFRNKNVLTPDVFRTNSGIELGMSEKDITTKIGDCYKAKKNTHGNKVVRYEITNNKHDEEFLTRYNMPEYYAEYEFKNDKLVKFRFGFEYP